MGNDIELERALVLPARAKVALALAAAQRALPRIAARKRAWVAYQKALIDGWRWVGEEGFEARDVYRHIEGLLHNHFEAATERESAACQAIVFALYAASREGGVKAPDLAELSERVVLDALARAAEAADVPELERAWQLVRLRELAAQPDATAPDDFGVEDFAPLTRRFAPPAPSGRGLTSATDIPPRSSPR